MWKVSGVQALSLYKPGYQTTKKPFSKKIMFLTGQIIIFVP